MTTVSLPPMTTDEFLRDFVHEKGIEFVNGQIERTPMPTPLHGSICLQIALLLMPFVRLHRLGRMVSNDSFIRLSNGDVRGPDLWFVSFKNWPIENAMPQQPLDVPIDLVIEVRSPSQTYREMTRKAEEYIDHGVRVAVIIDPDTHSAGIFRQNELPQRFHNGDRFELPDVLPGFQVPVAEFFM